MVSKSAKVSAVFGALVVSLTCLFTPVYAVNASIERDAIKLRDNVKYEAPRHIAADPSPGAEIQPVKRKTDEDLFYAGPSPLQVNRSGVTAIPCGSANATNTRVLSPNDAPGVITDQFGQAYLCQERPAGAGDAPEPVEYTLPDGEIVTAPEPITVSLEDFQNLNIAPSAAHQERAPHTLKNYNTNFWADPSEQTFDIEMSGVPVQVRAVPVGYTFDYGDGEYLGPLSYPGYQLGEDVWDEPTDTSHQYAEPGDYNFTLTTTYRGEYSVAGGPWQVISGTGQVVSDPLLVRVWRVRVGLVAGDCADDPTAWGCPGQ